MLKQMKDIFIVMSLLLKQLKNWISYISHYNNIKKTFRTNNFVFTAKETLELNDSFSFYLMNALFKEKGGISPNQLLELDDANVKNVFNSAF